MDLGKAPVVTTYMSSETSATGPGLVSAAQPKAPGEPPGAQTPSNVGPLSKSRMTEIATEACDLTLNEVNSYDHPRTAAWNTSIINKILQALLSAAANSSPYKFAVTSTIIEHITPPQPSSEVPLDDNDQTATEPAGETEPRETTVIARRGMHSATGAYWDNTKDGCWSFKYEKGEGKGFDVVVSVIWISVE